MLSQGELLAPAFSVGFRSRVGSQNFLEIGAVNYSMLTVNFSARLPVRENAWTSTDNISLTEPTCRQ